MAVKVEVQGPYACFSRPELSVERVSYDVMTPSAARGILEAVFWHPGLAWRIDRIHVLSPIRFTSVRRNEVDAKMSCSNALSAMNGAPGSLYISTLDSIQQRAALILRDVHYVIEAHFDMTKNAAPADNAGKFAEMMRRRLKKGQCFHTPYLGAREFPAVVKPWTGGEIVSENKGVKDLGLMLYDMDYSDPKNTKPMFFMAKLTDGVLDLTDCEVLR